MIYADAVVMDALSMDRTARPCHCRDLRERARPETTIDTTTSHKLE